MGSGPRRAGGSASEGPKKRRLRAGFVDRSARRGPLTAAGKARSCQNAHRHGLSASIFCDPAASAEIEVLTRKICPFGADAPTNGAGAPTNGAGAPTNADAPTNEDTDHRTAAADRELLRLARRIAQAQVDLVQVRRARHDLISRAFSNPRYRSGKNLLARIRQLAKAGELLRQGLALPADMRGIMEAGPQGAEKLALILSDASAELARMDRYERRALSRRKLAIREFDAARATTGQPIAASLFFSNMRR